MKTIYIEKKDKPRLAIRKMKIEKDNCEIYFELEKEKHIKKLIEKLNKYEIENVVLSKELVENKNLINALNANNINIFNGRWMMKYLAIEIIEYVVNHKGIKKEESEISIASNEITDATIEIIKKLSKQYKRLTVVTKHIEKLRKIEKEINEKEGILITVSNNQKKSLLKSQIILNMDFNKEVLNKYKINENVIIINLEGDMKIEEKRFNGININDYEIEVGREEIIWRENMEKFRSKDLLESVLYMKDTFENIYNKIKKNKVLVSGVFGINGKIERFS